MRHPLFDLARKLDLRAAERRQERALRRALSDPHLARDLALPADPGTPIPARHSW